MRFFRIPSFTGIEAHRDDADRGSLRAIEGCLPHGPGGVRSAPVWEEVGDVDTFSETEYNMVSASDDGNGNSLLFVSRLGQVTDLAILSSENTEVGPFGLGYAVSNSIVHNQKTGAISPIGDRKFAVGDGSAEAMYVGKGPPGGSSSVFPDEVLYRQEWSRFPNCKFYTHGPNKTIFAAGNPEKPLTVYVSEPAGSTNPNVDSPYSTELTPPANKAGKLSTVDILASKASKITALSANGNQVTVHTDKGCHVLYAPSADQANTGYRVEQAPSSVFSAAVSSRTVVSDNGSMIFWLGHDGQIYKDESAGRGSEDAKKFTDPGQANWKSKGIWEKAHPKDLSDSFSFYDPQSGYYWVFIRSLASLDHAGSLAPNRPTMLEALPEAPSSPTNLQSSIVNPATPTTLIAFPQNPAPPGSLQSTVQPPATPSELVAGNSQAPSPPSDLLARAPAPLTGPANLAATQLAPASGPTNLSTTLQTPAQGPTNLSALLSAPPVSGPSSLSAALLVPAQGPSNLNNSLLVPTQGPSSLSASSNFVWTQSDAFNERNSLLGVYAQSTNGGPMQNMDDLVCGLSIANVVPATTQAGLANTGNGTTANPEMEAWYPTSTRSVRAIAINDLSMNDKQIVLTSFNYIGTRNLSDFDQGTRQWNSTNGTQHAWSSSKQFAAGSGAGNARSAGGADYWLVFSPTAARYVCILTTWSGATNNGIYTSSTILLKQNHFNNALDTNNPYGSYSVTSFGVTHNVHIADGAVNNTMTSQFGSIDNRLKYTIPNSTVQGVEIRPHTSALLSSF